MLQRGQIGIAAQFRKARHDTPQGFIQQLRHNAVFARGIHHILDALLLFMQALRVTIQALLVMAQGIHRFLQLSLRAFQHAQRFTQACIMRQAVAQARH